MPVITIAGDLAPVGRNLGLFQSRLFRSLTDLGLCAGNEMVIANLECPLSDSGSALIKGGPNLRAPTNIAGAIRDFGISAVTLANNHILDYGATGLNETIESLSREGVLWFGAGASKSEAVRPLKVNQGSTKIELFGFAEKEYNFSTDRSPGASPLETSTLVRALRGAGSGSFVIALLHAGNEYFEYPSPWLRDTCRLAVECGANVVVCQHSHCIGCYESHAGGLIVYGQGNFVFDTKSPRTAWLLGLLLRLDVEGKLLKEFEFVPFQQDPGSNIVAPLELSSRVNVLSAFENRSRILQDEEVYLNLWNDFCERNRRAYQSQLFGLTKWPRRVNKLFGFCSLIPRRGQMNTGNVLRCRSHLEVLRHLYSQEKTC